MKRLQAGKHIGEVFLGGTEQRVGGVGRGGNLALRRCNIRCDTVAQRAQLARIRLLDAADRGAQLVNATARLPDVGVGLRQAGGKVLFGLMFIINHLAAHALRYGKRLIAHHLHELLVDGLLHGFRPSIHDLSARTAQLLIDVVVDLRTLEVPVESAQEACAEIFRQHDGSIVFARLHALGCFVLADKFPAHLVVLTQSGNHLIAHIHVPRIGTVGPFVIVDHGHLEVLGVLVRIPVGGHDVPRVQRRQQAHARQHDNRNGVAHDATHVLREDPPYDGKVCSEALHMWMPGRMVEGAHAGGVCGRAIECAWPGDRVRVAERTRMHAVR